MYYAPLDISLGVDGGNGIAEARQSVDTAYEYVLHSSGFKVVQDTEPVLRALIASYVHAHNFLHAVETDAYCYVHRLLDDLPLFPHMVVDGIQEHYHVLTFQRPRLPCLGFRKHPVGYLADHLGRGIYAVDVLKM